MSSYPYSLSALIESLIYSRWPFNNRIETAPRNVNQSGHYSAAGLANALSLPEVTTVVRDWTTSGWLIEIEIETGGEASISTYRSHLPSEASKIVSAITGSVKNRLVASGIPLKNSQYIKEGWPQGKEGQEGLSPEEA